MSDQEKLEQEKAFLNKWIEHLTLINRVMRYLRDGLLLTFLIATFTISPALINLYTYLMVGFVVLMIIALVYSRYVIRRLAS